MFKPVNVTWMLDHENHALADGDYEFRASVENLQHTYEASNSFKFRVEGGKPQVREIGAATTFEGSTALPAPGLVAALFGLIGLAMALRRRQKRC